MISAIFAIDKNNLFGKRNGLPWYISDDLKHFKETTLNSCVIMGYNTWKTLKKPLSNRLNIVVTHRKFGIDKSGVYFVNSLDMAQRIGYIFYRDIYLIGGAEIIRKSLNTLDRLIVTHINMEFEGNIYLDIDFNQWTCLQEKKLNSYCNVKTYMRNLYDGNE